LKPTEQSYEYVPGVLNVTVPMHVPATVPKDCGNANGIGLPKGSPVTLLVTPLTVWIPSMLMKDTESPGSTVSSAGVNSKFWRMTVWLPSHWADAFPRIVAHNAERRIRHEGVFMRDKQLL
jgi:hypothetical protein